MAHVIVPLPARDYDPTEMAVSWRVLTTRGHRVSFATSDGVVAVADDLMVDGMGLDPWGRIPVLRNAKLLGLVLRADKNARRAYEVVRRDAAFLNPLRWADMRAGLQAGDFDGLLLPGGHRARGMRAYIESAEVQAIGAAMLSEGKPVAAICHGVLVLARARDETTGRSPLYGRKTTALTWAMERSASRLARVGRFWDPLYYRTYPEAAGEPAGWMSVQAEVTRALKSAADFVDVPRDSADRWRKSSGVFRDSVSDSRPAFVVRDGNYVSARWPGDTHTFARTFAELLDQVDGRRSV